MKNISQIRFVVTWPEFAAEAARYFWISEFSGQKEPFKDFVAGLAERASTRSKRRPPTPSMPATPVSSIFARVAVAEWSARGARGGTCRKDGNPRFPTRPASSSYIVAMAGASDTVDTTTPTRTYEVSLHSVRAC